MAQVEVANWQSTNGGSADITLEAGTYRVEVDDIKVVTGPEDADFHIERPTVTLAKLVRTPGEGFRMVDYKGDGHPVPAYDVEPTETLTPLKLPAFEVRLAAEFRITWGGRGHITLYKVG